MTTTGTTGVAGGETTKDVVDKLACGLENWSSKIEFSTRNVWLATNVNPEPKVTTMVPLA